MLQFKMNAIIVLAVAVLWLCIIQVSSEDVGLSCASCGDECAEACGTRHFRTCCFNYLRKRSSGGSSSISRSNTIAGSITGGGGGGVGGGANGINGIHGTQQQYTTDTTGSSNGIIQSSFLPLQSFQNDNYFNQIDAQLRQLNSVELEKLWILMDSVVRRGQKQFLQPQIQSKLFEEFLHQQ